MISKSIDNSLFLDKYHTEHEFCPNCGEKSFKITISFNAFNLVDQTTYQDLDECECPKCGNIHTTHSKISETEAKILQSLTAATE